VDDASDPLADVLDLSRVSGALLAQLVVQDPWAIAVDPTPAAVFHAIVAGTCWLRVSGSEPIQLMTGDVVLLPTNVAHEIASEPEGPALSLGMLDKVAVRTPAGEYVLEGQGPVTRILCVSYEYDHEVAHPLMSLLPSVLHLPAGDPVDDGGIAATLRVIMYELGGRPPGSRAAASRLVDVLLVHVLRTWLRKQELEEAGNWLLGLRDPIVAATLARIHQLPQTNWTIESLAREASVSRATLARRFSSLVGEPPLAYLTRWRMDLAAQRLRDTNDTIEVIAAAVGYQSEYSFSRAFARARGEAPGRYRRLRSS
jgi:AraC-like DNA-binding protein